MSLSWRDSALAVMDQVRVEHLQAGVSDKAQIARAIDAAYPFGERAHYPYKAWLSARKAFFARHGLPLTTRRRRPPDLLDALVTGDRG